MHASPLNTTALTLHDLTVDCPSNIRVDLLPSTASIDNKSQHGSTTGRYRHVLHTINSCFDSPGVPGKR